MKFKSDVREVNRAGYPAALSAVLLHRPDAHPVWSHYLVGMIHLRELPNMRPPFKRWPDATHELALYALDPECKPNPEDARTLRLLSPPNLIHQLRGYTDEQALTLFGAFVDALASGELNPETDRRSVQLAWLERWRQLS